MKNKDFTTILVSKRAIACAEQLVPEIKGINSRLVYIVMHGLGNSSFEEDSLKNVQLKKMNHAWNDNEGNAWQKLYLKQVK